MADITEEDLLRAAERVREMQRRSSFNDTAHNMPPVPDFVAVPEKQKKSTPKNRNIKNINQNERVLDEKPKNTLWQMLDLKNFSLDNDRVLLIGIWYLLSGEESDEILTLALLYLML